MSLCILCIMCCMYDIRGKELFLKNKSKKINLLFLFFYPFAFLGGLNLK